MENPIKMDDSGRKNKTPFKETSKYQNPQLQNVHLNLPKKTTNWSPGQRTQFNKFRDSTKKTSSIWATKKPLLLSIESWLVNDGPYFMFYEIIPDYNWVGFHPLRKTQPTRLVFFIAHLKKQNHPKKDQKLPSLKQSNGKFATVINRPFCCQNKRQVFHLNQLWDFQRFTQQCNLFSSGNPSKQPYICIKFDPKIVV